jgi:hypothetical protein
MKSPQSLLIATLFFTGAALAANSASPAEAGARSQQEPQAAKNLAERKLPPEIASQHERIQRLLVPFAKGIVKTQVPEYLKKVKYAKSDSDFRQIAYSLMRPEFPRATRPQLEALTFELMAESCESGSIGDMSTKMQMELQMSQENYDKTMQAISNLMKSISATSDSVVSNIK